MSELQDILEAGQCPECKDLTAELNESERQTRAQLDRVLNRDKRIERLTVMLDIAKEYEKISDSEARLANAEIERYENAMREIQAATSDKVVLAITDKALCFGNQTNSRTERNRTPTG